MNVDELVACAREHGFEDLEAIRKLACRSVVLTPGELTGAAQIGSRLGGHPALPSSMPWPRDHERSLAFVAQIDLAAHPRIAADQGIPSAGLLLFFYDAAQETWGYEPADAGKFAVLHVPDRSTVSTVARWPDDLAEDARFPACGLVGEESVSLPPWESVLVEDLVLTDEQLGAYQDLYERTQGGEAWANRVVLGGHPDQIQGDMMLDCARIAAGLRLDDAPRRKDPRLPALRRDAREWRLLLQVPSVEAAGMLWGDAGCLYYWIREADLGSRRFERSWMIAQCS